MRDRIGGADGDGVGDEGDPLLLRFGDNRGLFLRRVVVVHEPNGANSGHGDGHRFLRDGVHGGGDARCPKLDVASEGSREVHIVDGEVDVAGWKMRSS